MLDDLFSENEIITHICVQVAKCPQPLNPGAAGGRPQEGPPGHWTGQPRLLAQVANWFHRAAGVLLCPTSGQASTETAGQPLGNYSRIPCLPEPKEASPDPALLLQELITIMPPPDAGPFARHEEARPKWVVRVFSFFWANDQGRLWIPTLS